ncbi:MAG TPA: conjugal transfer protein [Solirubrobacteraceae bacterium]|nr:conjugal transfer protein [Solirubrobacteraceae bacterium]
MPSTPPHSTVTVTARSTWRIRLARELPRYLLQALAIVGLLASARFAIAPPRPPSARVATPSADLPDRAGEGFASLFARRYLSWDSRDPEAHRLALVPYLSSSMAPEAGVEPPQVGEQRVQWTQVVQVRTVAAHRHAYTVAVQTDRSGLLYLNVTVARDTDGALALGSYPAFVGAPVSTTAVMPGGAREVEDPALQTVVVRALRNYLSGSQSELDADLAPAARVSLPAAPLTLLTLDGLDWSADGRSVLAETRARDGNGAQYTLAYELDVLQSAGRWEVSAIQMDPET